MNVEQTQRLVRNDSGYTHICVVCNKRYGAKITGLRTLHIARCDDHPPVVRVSKNVEHKTKIADLNNIFLRSQTNGK